MPQPCPCQSPQQYTRCCGPLHAGAIADTALALMRSRYSAYVLGDVPYLLATWHPSTRPATLALSAGTRWLGLSIKAHSSNGDAASVTFVARYREGGDSAVRMQECSQFVREGGRWFYVEARPN